MPARLTLCLTTPDVVRLVVPAVFSKQRVVILYVVELSFVLVGEGCMWTCLHCLWPCYRCMKTNTGSMPPRVSMHRKRRVVNVFANSWEWKFSSIVTIISKMQYTAVNIVVVHPFIGLSRKIEIADIFQRRWWSFVCKASYIESIARLKQWHLYLDMDIVSVLERIAILFISIYITLKASCCRFCPWLVVSVLSSSGEALWPCYLS